MVADLLSARGCNHHRIHRLIFVNCSEKFAALLFLVRSMHKFHLSTSNFLASAELSPFIASVYGELRGAMCDTSPLLSPCPISSDIHPLTELSTSLTLLLCFLHPDRPLLLQRVCVGSGVNRQCIAGLSPNSHDLVWIYARDGFNVDIVRITAFEVGGSRF